MVPSLAYVVYEHHQVDVQGLGMLAKKLVEAGMVRQIGWSNSTMNRAMMKVLMRMNPRLGSDRVTIYNRLATDLLGLRLGRDGSPVHVLWGDRLIGSVRHPQRHVFTLHDPYEMWNEQQWAGIKKARGILTMAEREQEEILARSPRSFVRFIPHGVDLEFWRPALQTQRNGGPPVICIVGRTFRNLEMIIRVASLLLRRRNDVRFEWLVNPDFVIPPEILQQLPPERFRVVRNLSAPQLRDFYQRSIIFFTPYANVTASNAIVEAMACGLPVVTTRVGGMSSYGGDSALLLVENDDDAAALDILERGIDDSIWRADWGARARNYAEGHFGWPRVVDAHGRFYTDLRSPAANAGDSYSEKQ
jgi:glycosyltransferase involved in cell wall biosynthesis